MTDAALERALENALDDASGTAPPRLAEALHYAVFPGGARVRPRLCLEVARAVNGQAPSELILAAACAVELLHCASLVHDDLPCFDDAAMRRGRPTVHMRFGEDTAVLVGDGLLVQSFATLAKALQKRPDYGPMPLLLLLDAAGPRKGLVAGQAWERESHVELSAYHRAKTAGLFEASAALGAIFAGAPEAPFARFGLAFGLAYQLADDVADVYADSSVLGKPVGRDLALARPSAARDLRDCEQGTRALHDAADAAIGLVPPEVKHASLDRFTRAVFDHLAERTKDSKMPLLPIRSSTSH